MTAKKVAIETNFKKYIMMLINDLIEMYPTMVEFKTLKGQLDAYFIIPGPEVVISLFKNLTEQFKEQIDTQNEKFFLEMDLKGTAIENLGYLKTVYENSSEETRKTLWKYINILTKLAQTY